MINMKFFAGLRDALGVSAESCTLPSDVTTVKALRRHLAGRGGPWSRLAEGGTVRCALNLEMAGDEAAISDGDEVAFFPPVTGG